LAALVIGTAPLGRGGAECETSEGGEVTLLRGNTMKNNQAEYWAPRIAAEWRKSVEGIVGVGRQLIAAKQACEHGEFLRLFKGHENAVSDPVPFSRQTGEQLMAVARCEPISNCQHVSSLPQSWGTLYELTKLDDETLLAGINAGEITPEMTRAQAAAMHSDSIQKPERELCVIVSEAFRIVYAKYAPQLDDASRQYVIERLESLVDLLKQEGASGGSRRTGNKGASRKAVAG